MNNLPEIQQKTYQVFHINVFTQQIYSGNSATVIWRSNGLSDKQMQLLAREFNTSESVFVSIINHELFVRFFTPIQEVASCGHGTIAAAYVAEKMLNRTITTLVLNTTVDNIKLSSVNEQYPEYKFKVPIPILEACIDIPQNIITSLSNIDVNMLDAYIVNTGSGKNRLLIRCKDESQLLSLSPNFSQLLFDLNKLNLFSVFVFSIDNQEYTQVSARMFAPNIGINEDPVNGNSSVALSCVIYSICKSTGIECPKKYHVNQGKAVNRKGKTTIHLQYDHNSIRKVELSGAVVELYNFNLPKLLSLND
jgi:PhzF family phenazine biosynthesis protein